MRLRRIVGQGRSVYHCMSRVVGGWKLFGLSRGRPSLEAEGFVELMRALAAFCGIRILSYALLGNHFHLLCEVEDRAQVLSDEEVLQRVEGYYGQERRQELAEALAQGAPGVALKERYQRRMNDLSVYLQELKGRFAQDYNRRHQRQGALWAQRFKSVLVEGEAALLAVAAYVDLNPVRAGLCTDPKDYRYSGYGEAVSGGKPEARAGLQRVLGAEESRPAWAEVSAQYRRYLYMSGQQRSEEGQGARRAGFNAQVVQQVVEEEQGKIGLAGLLASRVRYFSDGAVLGTKQSVQAQLERLRQLPIGWGKRGPCLRPLGGKPDALLWVLKGRPWPASTSVSPAT